MPGAIMTNLQKHLSDDAKKARGWLNEDGSINKLPKGFKTIEQGASTTVWAAVAPELENRGGLYLDDCRVASVVTHEEVMAGITSGNYINGVLAYALDESAAERLWEITEQALKAVQA